MNPIHHHPDVSTLIAYAAGAVTEAIGLVVATHTELCQECLARVGEAEAIGGAMLTGLPATRPPADGLAAVWEAIADEPRIGSETGKRPPRPPGVPATLAPYLPRGLSDVPWRRLAPGIHRYRLPGVTSGRGSVQLLSIAPGVTLPHHTHGGTELTLVLSGSYSDELGRFASGDLADLDPSISHQPVADAAGPCICLVATDEPLRFTGLVTRLLQPLARI